MTNLSDALSRLKKPHPSAEFSKKARVRLMACIDASFVASLTDALLHLQKPTPSALFFVAARQRIVEIPEHISWWISAWRPVFAGSTVVAFIAFFVFSFSLQTTSAEFSPTVSATTGTVEIRHLGEGWKSVSGNEKLRIGDVVRTAIGSEAVITLSEFSVSRLAPQTMVSIDALKTASSGEKTVLALSQGRVWSQIVSAMATKTPALSIATADSIVEATHAIFSVTADHSKTRISAFNHAVDVQLRTTAGTTANTTRISAGYETTITTASQSVKTASLEPISENAKKDPWITKNRALDQTHFAAIEAEIRDQIASKAGISSDSLLFPAKELIVSTQKQSAYDTAEAKFFDAIKLLSRGKTEIGSTRLTEAMTELSRIAQQKNDAPKVSALFSQMRIMLSPLLPTSPLYGVKEAIRGTLPKTEQTDRQIAIELLVEAQDLVAMNESELAADRLSAWKSLALSESGVFLASAADADSDRLMLHDILFTAQDSAIIGQAQTLSEHLSEKTESGSAIAAMPTAQKTVEKQLRFNAQLAEILERITVYESQRGQQNQTMLEVAALPTKNSSVPLLLELKKRVPESSRFVVIKKLLEIEQETR